MPQVLFLHGGPGLSAELERRRFGSSLPVHWWDQPRVVVSDRGPYEQLVGAALAELDRMFHRQGTRVPLLASSFGARLAFSLMECAPHQIGAVSFQGGTLNLRRAFVRLGRHVASGRKDNSLRALSDRAAQEPERVWDLISALFAVPNLLEFYWSPAAQSQCASMMALASEGRLMDAATFQDVVRDVVDHPALLGPIDWHAPLQVWLGKQDPYMQDSDVEEWRALLPRADVNVVETGHFPYMEMDPSIWLRPLIGNSLPSE